jgi:hypothetical protein
MRTVGWRWSRWSRPVCGGASRAQGPALSPNGWAWPRVAEPRFRFSCNAPQRPGGQACRVRIGPSPGAVAILNLQQCAALSDPDGRKAARGDAQRERSFASSRCQIGSAPRAGISSIKPWVRRVPTTLSAAPPLRLGASLMAPSSRYAAADSSTSWASVRLFGDSFFGDIVGILHSVCGGVSRRHHRSLARAQKPAGQDPMRALGALRRPEQ